MFPKNHRARTSKSRQPFNQIARNLTLSDLHKPSCTGVSPEAVKYFDSYLFGRSQLVRIGTQKSSSLPITHGEPQDAILPPLLFCIDTNDLPSTNNAILIRT